MISSRKITDLRKGPGGGQWGAAGGAHFRGDGSAAGASLVRLAAADRALRGGEPAQGRWGEAGPCSGSQQVRGSARGPRTRPLAHETAQVESGRGDITQLTPTSCQSLPAYLEGQTPFWGVTSDMSLVLSDPLCLNSLSCANGTEIKRETRGED